MVRISARIHALLCSAGMQSRVRVHARIGVCGKVAVSVRAGISGRVGVSVRAGVSNRISARRVLFSTSIKPKIDGLFLY